MSNTILDKKVRVLPPIDYMEERKLAESLKPNSRKNGANKKAIRNRLQ
jgi:hypothetical protein